MGMQLEDWRTLADYDLPPDYDQPHPGPRLETIVNLEAMHWSLFGLRVFDSVYMDMATYTASTGYTYIDGSATVFCVALMTFPNRAAYAGVSLLTCCRNSRTAAAQTHAPSCVMCTT